MKQIQLLIVALYLTFSASAQNKVKGYEYWFDNDYANKVTTAVTPVKQFSLNADVATTGLTNGIHTVNIRVVDNTEKYSSTLSHFFYKMPQHTAVNYLLVAYEYWFDNDYANAITVNTTAQKQVSVNDLISTPSLSNGIHTLNIRFKDNGQKWSSTLSQFFYKMPQQVSTAHKLVTYEYWFDNDYANVVTVNTPNQKQVAISDLINVQTLNNGIHTLNIRFKDNEQLWSSTLSQFFYKMPIKATVNNVITNYRYWVDNDFANATHITLPTSVKQLSLVDNLDFTNIPKGGHTVHFQFKDSLGLWSSVTTDSIVKISLPISNFSYTTDVKCDSTIYDFTDLSVDGDTYLWNFGDGATDTVANPKHTFYTPGSYQISLTVTDTLTMVDSTYLTTVSVTGNTAHSFSVTTCDSYTSPSGNYTFTTSGTFNDTIPNQWNCDSLLTIDVTINYATASTDVITACDSYTWINGNTYTASNSTATHTIINAAGCDSTITLHLTINKANINVTQDGISLTSSATGASYQWLDCNDAYSVISGEKSKTFTAIENGSYAVEVTQNGCKDTSACFTVTTVGIKSLAEASYKLYPNPVNDELTIESQGDINLVEVYSVTGQLLQTVNPQSKVIKINVSTYEQGVYLIKLHTTDGRIKTSRVVKN